MRKYLTGFLSAAVFVASAGEAADSLLSESLREVVVTGSNLSVERNLLPYTVTAMNASQIEATGSVQLLSAVSGVVPSLFLTERNVFGFGVSGGGAGHIKMRGVGGDRASAVLMMVDGQPQFAGLYSHHVADFYPSEYVERVEVLRGPASVLYGSNAMAGVINIITRNPHERGVKVSLTSQYGSYNTWLSSLTATARYGRFSALASLSYDRTDGLKKNFDFKQLNSYAKVGYAISDYWSAKADYTIMSFTGNDPVYPLLKGDTGVYHQNVTRGESSVMATNRYGSTNGAIRAYYSYGNHFIHDPYYFHSLDDRLGVIVYQNLIPWREAAATVGFDFDRYSGKIPFSGGKNHEQAPLATMNRRNIAEYSPYVTLSQSFWQERVNVSVGLRLALSSMFSSQWVPQAGFSFLPGCGWMLKASLARGYRNSSFRELYLYKFANPDLAPERMMNYEVTLGYHPDRLFSFDLTGYYAKGSDMIQQSADRNENTGSFINKGVELSAKSHPLRVLRLWATYSYLHTSLNNLTGAPTHQYYFGVGWDSFGAFHADAELKGVSGLYVADDVRIQNYATVNLRFTYQVMNHLQLMLTLDNVTDTHYEIIKGYPMPGFTAMGGFKLTL